MAAHVPGGRPHFFPPPPPPPPGSKKIELRRVRVRGRSGPDNHLLCKETGVKCLVRAERSCERREFEDQVHVLAGKRVHVTTAGSPFAPTSPVREQPGGKPGSSRPREGPRSARRAQGR